MEMHPTQQHFRIKVAGLKAHLIRKLGPGLSKQYFYYLNKLFSLKISKVEFNKICCRILGRKNIALHNHFIRSILKNTCSAKHPPPGYINDDVNGIDAFGSKETPTDLYGSRNATSQASHSHIFSNGDMLPLSPRKAHIGYRDQSSGDLNCALGANGKTNLSSQQVGGKELSNRSGAFENGFFIPADVQGLVQQHERSMTYAENERAALAEATVELSEERGVQNGPVSMYNRNQIEASIKQEGNELHVGNQLRAPPGIVFSPDSVSLAHKAMTLPSKSNCITASNSGLLLDSLTLRERIKEIAALQGLEGLSTDCVSILNNGLNAYLKGLISSCVKLVSARSEQELIKNNKFVAPPKLAYGFRPGHNIQIHKSCPLMDVTPEIVVSLQDFRVAMELNPQQLGEDWTLLLEKICMRSYDE